MDGRVDDQRGAMSARSGATCVPVCVQALRGREKDKTQKGFRCKARRAAPPLSVSCGPGEKGVPQF